MRKVFCLLLTASLLLQTAVFTVVVHAEDTITQNLMAAADTYVHDGNKGNNFGGDTYAFSAAQIALSREIFMRFDLSALKENAYEVLDAQLSLQIQKTGGQNNQSYKIYAVPDSGWTEGAGTGAKGTATGIATDLTWNNSRAMAEQSVEIFDGSSMRPAFGTPFTSDITRAVHDAVYADTDTLVLRIVTTFRDPNGKNTYGIHVFTKESEGADTQKPQLILTLRKNQDKTDVYAAAGALALTGIETVAADLPLPAAGERDTTISWTSSNADVLEIVEADGAVTAKYKDVTAQTAVTLTATIHKGEESLEKTFTVQVFPAGMSDTERDLQAMALTYDPNALTIALPASGESGSAVTWESDLPEVVDGDGRVMRPALADKQVTLTATAQKDGCEDAAREFVLTIPALGRMVADKDTSIRISADSASSARPRGADPTMETGVDTEMQKFLMGFDLSEVPKTVKKATLSLTRSDNNINWLNFFEMGKDDWDEATLCGNNYHTIMAEAKGPKAAEVRMGGSGRDIKYAVDVTAAVQRAMAGDKYLSLEGVKFNGTVAGESPGGAIYPSALHTREAAITDYGIDRDFRPYLVFEYTEDADEIALIEQLNKVTLPAMATDTLTLPAQTETGLPINWVSKAPAVIANDGTVTPQATETSVRMTASVTQNGKTVTRDFFVILYNPTYDFMILDTFFKAADGNLVSLPSGFGSAMSVRLRRTGTAAGTLLLGVYNGNVLIGCATADVAAGTVGEELAVPVTGITFPENAEGYRFKAFVWTSVDGLQPLALAQ